MQWLVVAVCGVGGGSQKQTPSTMMIVPITHSCDYDSAPLFALDLQIAVSVSARLSATTHSSISTALPCHVMDPVGGIPTAQCYHQQGANNNNGNGMQES